MIGFDDYQQVNGTFYHPKTTKTVISVLERLRENGTRAEFHYGDAETGRAWGDTESGRIGRSTGRIKIPLVIHNKRSMGGGALLDHCVIGIRETTAPHAWIYRSPSFAG